MAKLPTAKSGKWIQKAVNPKHKGYCTPMTKSTCTPKRKALARTFKKHHGFHEDGGAVPMQDPSQQMQDPSQQQAPGQMPPVQGGQAPGPEQQQQVMQQMMQMVMQALQQGQKPDQIVQMLVQKGVPQEIAQQAVQATMQQAQGGQQQGPQEEQQEPQQETPQQEMQEGAQSMRYGGKPCMNCGGKLPRAAFTNKVGGIGTPLSGPGLWGSAFGDPSYNSQENQQFKAEQDQQNTFANNEKYPVSRRPIGTGADYDPTAQGNINEMANWKGLTAENGFPGSVQGPSQIGRYKSSMEKYYGPLSNFGHMQYGMRNLKENERIAADPNASAQQVSDAKRGEKWSGVEVGFGLGNQITSDIKEGVGAFSAGLSNLNTKRDLFASNMLHTVNSNENATIEQNRQFQHGVGQLRGGNNNVYNKFGGKLPPRKMAMGGMPTEGSDFNSSDPNVMTERGEVISDPNQGPLGPDGNPIGAVVHDKTGDLHSDPSGGNAYKLGPDAVIHSKSLAVTVGAFIEYAAQFPDAAFIIGKVQEKFPNPDKEVTYAQLAAIFDTKKLVKEVEKIAKKADKAEEAAQGNEKTKITKVTADLNKDTLAGQKDAAQQEIAQNTDATGAQGPIYNMAETLKHGGAYGPDVQKEAQDPQNAPMAKYGKKVRLPKFKLGGYNKEAIGLPTAGGGKMVNGFWVPDTPTEVPGIGVATRSTAPAVEQPAVEQPTAAAPEVTATQTYGPTTFDLNWEKDHGMTGKDVNNPTAPHPTYGFNATSIPGYKQGTQYNLPESPEEAQQFYDKYRKPAYDAYGLPQGTPLYDMGANFAYNHAQDPRLGMLQTAGVIDHDKRRELYNNGTQNTAEIDKLWGANKDAITAKATDRNFVDKYKTTLDDIYANTGSDPIAKANWKQRVGDKYNQVVSDYFPAQAAPIENKASVTGESNASTNGGEITPAVRRGLSSLMEPASDVRADQKARGFQNGFSKGDLNAVMNVIQSPNSKFKVPYGNWEEALKHPDELKTAIQKFAYKNRDVNGAIWDALSPTNKGFFDILKDKKKYPLGVNTPADQIDDADLETMLSDNRLGVRFATAMGYGSGEEYKKPEDKPKDGYVPKEKEWATIANDSKAGGFWGQPLNPLQVLSPLHMLTEANSAIPIIRNHGNQNAAQASVEERPTDIQAQLNRIGRARRAQTRHLGATSTDQALSAQAYANQYSAEEQPQEFKYNSDKGIHQHAMELRNQYMALAGKDQADALNQNLERVATRDWKATANFANAVGRYGHDWMEQFRNNAQAGLVADMYGKSGYTPWGTTQFNPSGGGVFIGADANDKTTKKVTENADGTETVTTTTTSGDTYNHIRKPGDPGFGTKTAKYGTKVKKLPKKLPSRK